MTASWQRLKDLVADALELSPPERPAFVAAACGDDAELRREAAAMLDAATDAGDFLAAPALPPGLSRLVPGTQVDSWRIEELLGEGGFSEVYRAVDTGPVRREIALKVLKPGMDSRGVLRRFELEHRTLARMNHPAIARVLDAGATPGGRPWVAMDLVRGEPLHRFVAAANPSLTERIALFLQVCAAVTHAHRRGVIHRDLKPSNVLVEIVDGRPCAKVIDFGIARLIDRGDDAATMTAHGAMVGTPAYASPEQLDAEHGDIDTRTDVYALGVMLYELLCGQRPTDDADGTSPTFTELCRRARGVDPVPPSRRVAGITPFASELDWIALKALARERDQRYAGVDELATDLQRHLDGDAVLAGPPTRSYRLRKFVRRHRLALASVALVLFALAAGGIAAVVGYWHAEAGRVQAEQARGEADATADYLQRLIAAAIPGQQGRDVKVIDLLAASGPILQTAAANGDVHARLQHTIGLAYLALGEFAAAETHIRAAADARRRVHGPLDWRGIEAACDLAGVLGRAGRIDLAAAVVDDVEPRAIAAKGDDHPRARVLADLRAKFAFDRGRPAEAEAPLRRLLALDEAEGRVDAVIATCGNLSQVLLGLRRVDEATALAQRALDTARRQHGAEHPITISAARKRATVHLQAGEAGAAIALLEPLVGPAVQRLGEDHADALGMRSTLARALLQIGRGEQARRLLQDLAERQQRKLGRLHAQAMLTLFDLGVACESAGDLPAAETALGEAASRFAEARGVDDGEATRARIAHCRVVAAQGRHQQIATDYGDAMTRAARSRPADDPWLRSARRDWLRHLRALAADCEARGASADAKAAWLQAEQVATVLGDADTAAAARAAGGSR